MTVRRLAVCALALAASAPAASPAHAAAQRCGALHGHRILTTPALRVVSVRLDEVNRSGGTHLTGRRFLACARPGGTVREIGSIYREYPTTGPVRGFDAVDSGLTSFGRSAGTFLITRTREADLSGDYAEQRYRVVNVATGRSYTYFHHLEGDRSPGPRAPVRTALDAQGRLAAIVAGRDDGLDDEYSGPPAGRAQVVVYSAAGARTVLDDAPADAIPLWSLSLANGIVSWLDAGSQRTASAP
jgi:hypothetical protein